MQQTPDTPAAIQRRTLGDLQAAARVRAEERTWRLEAKRAAEAAREKAKAEAERARYLDQLESVKRKLGNASRRAFRSGSRAHTTRRSAY